MRPRFLSCGLLLVAIVAAQTPPPKAILPQKVQSILREYESTVEQAAKRAIHQLEAVKQAETQRGNLEGAVAVRQKIEELKAVTRASESPPFMKATTVSSKTAEGASLGPAKKGQRIHVQYTGGTWANGRALTRVSPDGPPLHDPTSRGLERAVLVGIVGGKGERITVLPAGTQENPFVTTAAKDFDDVRIVMSDTLHADNAGEVVYRTAIR